MALDTYNGDMLESGVVVLTHVVQMDGGRVLSAIVRDLCLTLVPEAAAV